MIKDLLEQRSPATSGAAGRCLFEDLAIAALVMLPFTFALTLFVNSMAWWPSAVMIVLAGLVQGFGTFWNAGWRARTAQWGEGE